MRKALPSDNKNTTIKILVHSLLLISASHLMNTQGTIGDSSCRSLFANRTTHPLFLSGPAENVAPICHWPLLGLARQFPRFSSPPVSFDEPQSK